jgi:hypothetical protein
LLIITSYQETFEPNKELNVLFAYEEEQERLDNLGNPSGIPDGHAAKARISGLSSIRPGQKHDSGSGGSLLYSFQ